MLGFSCYIGIVNVFRFRVIHLANHLVKVKGKMADFYEEMQKVVQGVLPQFNQGTIRYRAVTPGGGPADEPGASSITWTTLTGAAARGVSTQYVLRGLAIASDKQVVMAVQAGVSPAQDDFVQIDGEQFKIVSIMTKPEAGTPVAYVLIVRR
jgi:hypothetical protein